MEFKPILRFGVVSDVHYSKSYPRVVERFRNTMKFMYDYADSQPYKGLDALYVVGDFVDTTLYEQYKMFADDCHELLREETILRVMQSNHDLHYLPEPLTYHDAENYFRELFRMPFDDHLVIGGYHFISLSDTYTTGKWHGSLSDAKVEYLRQELAKAHADTPEKPIFVFRHCGVTGTNSGGRWGQWILTPILSEYPQVVYFSGHSHCPINDPEAIDQTNFTTVDTGCFLNITSDKRLMNQYAQCLLVEVDAQGTVRIKRIDAVNCVFYENDWILEEPWNKEKFTYTKARADAAPTPYFAKDTKITAEKSAEALTLTIPQAICEGGRVRHYLVQLVDADDNDLSKFIISSGFPGLTMPETVTGTLTELPEGPYRIKITAVGVWDKYSDPLYINE